MGMYEQNRLYRLANLLRRESRRLQDEEPDAAFRCLQAASDVEERADTAAMVSDFEVSLSASERLGCLY